MRKFLFLIFSLYSSLACAYDFYSINDDGKTIYYNILSAETCEVTSQNGRSGSYSGKIRIPKEVSFSGKTLIVSAIGDDAFSLSKSLISVEIPSSVTSIGEYSFMRCSSLASIVIPSSVTCIGKYAFQECSLLTTVVMPNSVTSIGVRAFDNCSSLASIVIPSNVTSIGSWAFDRCSSLIEIKVLAENPPSIDRSFEYSKGGQIAKILYVPIGSKTKYEAAPEWKDFWEIIEFNPENDDAQNPLQQCCTPTINYNDGLISFDCATDGVRFYSEITDTDVKSYDSEAISLSVSYAISVYATKEGYANSKTATATLCWLESDPKTEGINDITRLRTTPVLISSVGSTLNITGAENADHIEFYNLSGSYLGAEQVINGEASFETDENLVIVKIGEKSIKVKK